MNTTEQKVLALLLKRPSESERLKEEYFQSEDAKELFKHIQTMYMEEDTVTTDRIERLYGEIPSEISYYVDHENLTDFSAHVKDLYEDYNRARVINLASRLLQEAHTSGRLNYDTLNSILDIEFDDLDSSEANLAIAAKQYLNTLNEQINGTYKYCSTGYDVLDRKFGGEYRPRSLILMYGDSGHGKTAFTLDAIRELKAQDIKATFISVEMKVEDLVTRMLASRSGIPLNRLNDGRRLREEDTAIIEEEIDKLVNSGIRIVDDATTSNKILKLIKRQAKQGVRVFFIDYLQLITASPIYNAELRRYVQPEDPYGYITRELRKLAKSLDITIVVLSQVTQGLEGMNRCRDSKTPPKEADIVIEITLFELNPNEDFRYGEIAVYKNRYEALGKIPIMFDGTRQTFGMGSRLL